ncbi:MAG: HAMP domain-containing histidine kinase [Firmicutes bacterium]|nr:HAMP domain-containing histidine kinase [Bacillota bacterium]
MILWQLIFICILLCIIIFLTIKLIMIKKSAKEIADKFSEIINSETNILIDISSRDSQMRRLAAQINTQLRNLRSERHRLRHEDIKLKDSVTNISHDLRTPLTAICGYLDLLEREDLNENAQRYINIIKNRVKLMEQFTEELFGYSVVLTKPDLSKKEPIIINHILEESILSFYMALNENNITPNINITAKPIIRNLNKSALSRIFANLINNAIKYSDGDLNISLLESGEIIFSNTASDLDEIQTGRLFDRFYTVETAQRSTGLGLSITRTLTEQMDGTIKADYSSNRLNIYLNFPL